MKNVYTICYNRLDVFKSKEEAIENFSICCSYCDPCSAEFMRYANIIVDLNSKNIGKDNVDDYVNEIYYNDTKENIQLKERKHYMDVIKEIEGEK